MSEERARCGAERKVERGHPAVTPAERRPGGPGGASGRARRRPARHGPPVPASRRRVRNAAARFPLVPAPPRRAPSGRTARPGVRMLSLLPLFVTLVFDRRS